MSSMRGTDRDQGGLFSYVSMEQRIAPTHPLRRIRALLDEALGSISRDFDRVYAEGGRESVAPERLVRALLLQVLYSIRSERLLCEQLDYNLLFRWFVGLSMDDRIWHHSTFTKNRDRLIEAGVARKLLRRIGQGRAGAAQDAGARTAERDLHGDPHDRLQQPAAHRQAPARSGTSVGHVSMKSGQSLPRRLDPLAQHAGIGRLCPLPHERLRK
jgi:transposase